MVHLFWYVGVILTNTYIIYMRIYNMNGTPRKKLLYHYGFRRSISFEWINMEKYSAEEFEFQQEIPAPRRKIILDFSSSC